LTQKSVSGCHFSAEKGAYLEDVSPGVIVVAPAEAVQHLEHLVALQDGEDAVEQDFESYGQRLAPVQHQRGHVERHRGLHRLDGRPQAQFVQRCNKKKDTRVTRLTKYSAMSSRLIYKISPPTTLSSCSAAPPAK